MFIAVNENGEIIGAEEATKRETYYCSICHSEVILKRGTINVSHFAHKEVCTDNWHYDTSEWHRQMQQCFPKEAQEVVLNYRGKKHRADIFINGIVIEFQHSPISAEEYRERTEFFLNQGLRIAWVFDVSEEYDYERIRMDDDGMWEWSNPGRWFSAGQRIWDDNKKFAVWLFWKEENGDEFINKVCWTASEDNRPSMKRFVISDNVLEIKSGFNVEELFLSRQDWFNKKLKEIAPLDPQNIKYRGVKGQPPPHYCCPKRDNEFGLEIYGKKGCAYCRYCGAIAQRKRGKGFDTTYIIACYYPNEVRELDGIEEYECSSIKIDQI